MPSPTNHMAKALIVACMVLLACKSCQSVPQDYSSWSYDVEYVDATPTTPAKTVATYTIDGLVYTFDSSKDKDWVLTNGVSKPVYPPLADKSKYPFPKDKSKPGDLTPPQNTIRPVYPPFPPNTTKPVYPSPPQNISKPIYPDPSSITPVKPITPAIQSELANVTTTTLPKNTTGAVTPVGGFGKPKLTSTTPVQVAQPKLRARSIQMEGEGQPYPISFIRGSFQDFRYSHDDNDAKLNSSPINHHTERIFAISKRTRPFKNGSEKSLN
ncbi:hypothetical protein CROQUDRAFT_706620 [Cronartium quercuum f. sp. fusiforme G11]|uniref:Uncharacterized protein n=1 Tax=Cronartium quercuum f. sp. fusiforme G11 TaxID=708437 RepID=A0A9P6TAK1_9BASI|nr:hypothetical protein CROQUDRAFT_706620 [Cronartium quercuum f. sp. fusiforme G11]